MLSRVSSALQSAADVLAPPASRNADFEYHWKLIQNYYHTHDENCKEHIEETNIPHHLYHMLQLLVEEENESPDVVGPCVESLINGSLRLLDGLSCMCAVERPPGARALALGWCTALLRRLRTPLIHHATIYRPIQRILIQCSETPASPTEKEEVELLLTLCGLVRKEPGLANVFTTPFVEDKSTLLSIPEDMQEVLPVRSKILTPKKNLLFEFNGPPDPLKKVSIVTQMKGNLERRQSSDKSISNDEAASLRSQKTVYDDNDKFLLIDLLLAYLNSPDNHIVLRACEGVMIVSSLPDEDIANLVSGCSSVCETLVHKLCEKYRYIPTDIDPENLDLISTSWGYVAQDFGDKFVNKFHGYRELASFLSWLDYIDTLMKECHNNIASHLARTFRQNFLEATIEIGLNDLHHTVLVTGIISKCLKVIDSTDLINEISNWLVGDGEIEEWPLLHMLIENCLNKKYALTLETLKFFETIIEKPTEHSLQRLILCRLGGRGYYCATACKNATDDEEERDRLNAVSLQRERDSNREAMKQLQHEGRVTEQISDLISQEGGAMSKNSAYTIHRVINSFLLLLPKALLSDPIGIDYEQYIHDAHRHYQAWLDIMSQFSWSADFLYDTTASSTHSYDSRPEADHDGPAPLKNQTTNHENPSQPRTDMPSHPTLTRKVSVKSADGDKEKSFRRISQSAYCCTEDDIRLNRIGKCGKPASQCPFSQNLVLRNCDLVPSKDDDETFDEGPFLRMLFQLLSNVPYQCYQINLQLTSIISKLAMLPHANLHEYLLNPMLPTSKNTRTLFKVLQNVSKRLTMEIPRVKNYAKLIETTRLQLMGEEYTHDDSNEHSQLFEGLIVVEEFCKELAAIAFVKHQLRIHSDS